MGNNQINSTRNDLAVFIDAGITLLQNDARMFASGEADEILVGVALAFRLIARDIAGDIAGATRIMLGAAGQAALAAISAAGK